jgi:uncharacterized membrane protein
MDQTHIHLLITHLPIFGSVLGALVLLHGIYMKSEQTKIAAYNLFIISAIGAGIAYATGEAAEETVERIAGVSEAMIEEHEDAAIFALWGMIILGIVSLAGVFLTVKKHALASTASIIILLLSLFSFSIVARTGYLGGQIRHSEIRVESATQQEGEVEDDN